MISIPFRASNYYNPADESNSSYPEKFALKVAEPRERVLIVEDDLINQRVLSVYLNELCQTKIDITQNGQEALTLFNKYNYALIFLDLDLPDINGIEVCKAIKNSCNKESPSIVIATSHHEDHIKKECYELGATAFITKPLDFDTLKQKLSFWLNKNSK